MRVEIVTPAAPKSVHNGNRTTAERWSAMLAELGHDVSVTAAWSGAPVDALVALHARKSAASVRGFAEAHPDRPLVLALTGTDLYGDLGDLGDPDAQQALRCADALVVLQARAVASVPADVRERVRVIHQSVEVPTDRTRPRDDVFEVLVVAHLREVKDPLLPARAALALPADSRIEVVHCGAGLDPGWTQRAQAEAASNPRWRWLGAQPREEVLRLLARARLLVIPSRLEGGANVVSEAIAVGTPVLATRIEGSMGLLGEDYPGYVRVGDAEALAQQLRRAEVDPSFYADLTRRTASKRDLVEPARERGAWAQLLGELA